MALMRELLPGMARVAVLVNPANAVIAEVVLRDAETVARAMGLQILELKASTSREIGAAFTRLAGEQPDALFVAGDGFLISRRVQLVNLAVAPRDRRDICRSSVLRSRRADELRKQQRGRVASSRRLHRP